MPKRIQWWFSDSSIIQLNYIFCILILIAMEFILTSAFYYQFIYHEIPCPLCLLQRVAYLGICFGIILNLRCGYSLRHDGLIVLMTVFLLIMSTRQTLLDICPRAGHEYIGSAIFGIHMSVWSILFSVMLLLAYTFRFLLLGYGDYLVNARLAPHTKTHTIASVLIGYAIIICAINLVSSFLQCGLESCHTFNYRLLS